MTTIKSQQITDVTANPGVALEARNLGGRLRIATGTLALATTDIDDDDIILLARLKTMASIHSIMIFNDDMDLATALAYDVGLYNTDGTVKDRIAYASAATDFQAPNVVGKEVAFEARDITKIGQRVWEDAGDTTDPGGQYDIAITIETVATTAQAGDLSWRILYTED